MTGRRLVMMALLAAVLVVAACSPDPYNLHPQALKVERIVVGGAALELQPPRAQTGEFLLYEGEPYPDGGIVYKPFYLTDVEITPTVGGAILARKGRYGEIFGLLSRGVVGEASNNRLVPRVGLGELTVAERSLVEAENRDRAIVLDAFMKGKRIAAVEADAVRRVLAYARYQVLSNGVWVEKVPGEWVIKGGREYRGRVMAREPVPLQPPPPASTPAPVRDTATTSRVRTPQPSVR